MATKFQTGRARTLRRDKTEVERKLWALLRNRQLGGFKFRRQYPIDRYIADFASVEAKLVVELDGGQHSGRTQEDAERTEALERAGWQVIRFWNGEAFENAQGVAETILNAIRMARR